RITSFNRAAEKITGVPREEALGRLCSEVFRSSLCGAECALRETVEGGREIIGKSAYIVTADGDRIPISISTAVLRDSKGRVIGGAEVFRDMSDIEAMREELEGRNIAEGITSNSPAMQRVLEIIPVIAASPSTVLIQGETGTGKEVVARAIHENSPRKDNPFVAINCGALPDSLLESELFGYKRGAFTDAVRDKPGRFAIAKGGTLFLDEIGEISTAMQVRLFRVLQERVYEPLGSSKSEKADVRIIAATNADLLQLCKEGVFREDLYYRINVVRIELPPLRERREDIALLSSQFIARFNRLQDKRIEGLTTEALSLLMAHDWRGNVRELENAIERAFILCSQGRIGIEHLPESLTGSGIGKSRGHTGNMLKAAYATIDAQTIRAAIARQNGNKAAAARDLGIHKTTLYRKIKALGLKI
ncbi:MAG: sigma 54-interacting transcriptional regulator, partial [Lentisphaerae bacterium]|nr:sigma 54-interacting transcriptional regulator [Lentisphaerota bacterium]